MEANLSLCYSAYIFCSFNKKFRHTYLSLIDNRQYNRFRVFWSEGYVIDGFKTNLSSKS